MEIVSVSTVKIDDVIRILDKGGLVIYPTETMYGIGADATNSAAIKKLNRYKKRPAGKPYSIATSGKTMAEGYVFINKVAANIYKSLLPGPVTVVSHGKHNVAPGVESEAGTLGIRIPDHKLVIDIIKKFGRPITSTSANASYKKRPYKISDVLDNISESQKKLIDLIIDSGELPHKDPSTVVDTTCDDLTVLRQGEILFNNKNEILSRNEEETKNFAKELWQKYEIHFGRRAFVFALTGEMGSGKTVFTKGLAKAVGVTDLITSPTFNLQISYKLQTGHQSLVHIDTWRMSSPSEIYDLDFGENISECSIIVIEWADKIVDEIKKYTEGAVVIWVQLTFGKRENERLIRWMVAK